MAKLPSGLLQPMLRIATTNQAAQRVTEWRTTVTRGKLRTKSRRQTRARGVILYTVRRVPGTL
jgi:hypothetical protein